MDTLNADPLRITHTLGMLQAGRVNVEEEVEE